MAKIVIDPKYLVALSELDASITRLNIEKLKLLLELLSIEVSTEDFEKIVTWDIILISVLDKQMAVQLNKLSAYMPNLKFVVASERDLFTLYPGEKKRRVWKER